MLSLLACVGLAPLQLRRVGPLVYAASSRGLRFCTPCAHAHIDSEATRDHASSSGLKASHAEDVALVGTLGLFPRDTREVALCAGLATISSFTNEEPTKDSSELGLEEARRIAEGGRKVASKPKCEVAWCSALSVETAERQLFALTDPDRSLMCDQAAHLRPAQEEEDGTLHWHGGDVGGGR